MTPAPHASSTRSSPRRRFERIYREHAPFVWAAARQCGAPAAVVDDVVQDVFVTAYRRLDDLRGEVSPRGWLYGVTRRVAFRYRRSAARTARRVTAVAATTSGRDDPRAGLEASREVDALLEQLPPRQRELVIMSELLGMSGPEIAAELGVPVNTAYSRVRAVRARLESLAQDREALDRALTRCKAEARPSQAQVERGWVALAATVRSPWAAALEAPRATTSLLTTLGGATALGATLLVVGVLARGAVWGAGTSARAKPNAEPNARAAGSALAEPTPHAPTPLGPSPAPAPARLEPAPIEPTPPVPAPLVPAPIVRDSAPAPAPAPADASPSTPRRPPPNPASPSPTPRAGIEAELALLEHARRALAAHRPAEALASLDEHARRFPRGDLADARMASRVRALCQQGDRRGARAEADRLRRQHPGSALATGLDDPCAETPEP